MFAGESLCLPSGCAHAVDNTDLTPITARCDEELANALKQLNQEASVWDTFCSEKPSLEYHWENSENCPPAQAPGNADGGKNLAHAAGNLDFIFGRVIGGKGSRKPNAESVNGEGALLVERSLSQMESRSASNACHGMVHPQPDSAKRGFPRCTAASVPKLELSEKSYDCGRGNTLTPRKVNQKSQRRKCGKRGAVCGNMLTPRKVSQYDRKCRKGYTSTPRGVIPQPMYPSLLTSRGKAIEKQHEKYLQRQTPRGAISRPAYPSLLASLGKVAEKQQEKRWQRTCLDCMIVIGDVLAIADTRQITQIGATGGMFGHVVVVASAPQRIQMHTPESFGFLGMWPADKVREIYQVPVIESTRRSEGINETDLLLYVHPKSGNMILLGEVDKQGAVTAFGNDEPEKVELWQCPPELRGDSCRDLKEAVLDEMREHQANWSWYTAVRAFLLPATMANQSSMKSAMSRDGRQQLLKEVQDCWKGAPICSSLPIIFWQRYLCKLSQSGRAAGELPDADSLSPIDLIMTRMPLKADRALPGELLDFLKSSGWTNIQRLPAQKAIIREWL